MEDKLLFEFAEEISNYRLPRGHEVKKTYPQFAIEQSSRKIPTLPPKTKAVKGEAGIFILEGSAITNAPEIADYTQYKTQGIQALKGRGSYYVGEAIKENAKIVDNKAKFF